MGMKLAGIVLGMSISFLGVLLLVRNLWQSRRNQQKIETAKVDFDDAFDLDDDDLLLEGEITEQKMMSDRMSDRHSFSTSTDDILKSHATTSLSSASEHKITDIKHRYQPKPNNILIFYVMAKPEKQFAGYELAQAVAESNLCFGEMNIFHRHQYADGSGDVCFSVASATKPGTFDISKLTEMRCLGLSLFMQLKGNDTDRERFELMLKTANQLAEGLDGILLDEERKPLTESAIYRYRKRVQQLMSV